MTLKTWIDKETQLEFEYDPMGVISVKYDESIGNMITGRLKFSDEQIDQATQRAMIYFTGKVQKLKKGYNKLK